jgi:dTDP-4-amino-4,6-dideoxygalactose transaminase
MPNINAALGCAQMEQLDDFVQNKRETAKRYKIFFDGYPDIQFFTEPDNCQSNYWLNVVILKDKQTQLDFLSYTNDHDVMTRPVWELMTRLPMFADCQSDDLTNTNWFEERLVNIPSSVRKK